MDGPSLINFTVGAIPKLVDDILVSGRVAREQVDYYIFHQATQKMLVQLQQRLQVTAQQMPIVLADCGNTVSSTIPLVIERMRHDGRLKAGMHNMLVGFGVGWSWSGCIWEETWRTAATPQ
jgi:3-oxoacyl-[acyl-carrier-protein] synthase-3